MVNLIGRRQMPLALTLSGFVIGIAIFSDVGYVILNPLVHSAALTAGTNMGVMATGLVGAMQLTHALVPPTPGPLAAVALVKADLGKVVAVHVDDTVLDSRGEIDLGKANPLAYGGHAYWTLGQFVEKQGYTAAH